MEKDYINWNEKKIKINNIIKRPFFHNKEIWWCNLGINIGFEQDGRGKDFLRPVIVFRKFNNTIFWAIPLTHTIKNNEYYMQIRSGLNKEASTAILSQIRLIDSRRLSHKFGKISDNDMRKLIEKIKALLP